MRQLAVWIGLAVVGCGGLPAPSQPAVAALAPSTADASGRVVEAFVAEGVAVQEASPAVVIGTLAEREIEIRYVANIVAGDSGSTVTLKPFAKARELGTIVRTSPDYLEFDRSQGHAAARAAWARVDRIVAALTR